MKLLVVDITGKETPIYSRPLKKTLGETFNGHLNDIAHVQINDEWVLPEFWIDYTPQKQDTIRIYAKTEDFFSIAINIILSIAFAALASLFAPTPKKPSASKNQPALGVAGIQNTIAAGTPKFFSYGTRRVFGHLIASTVDVVDQFNNRRFNHPDIGRKMSFSALYYMGVGEISSMSAVQINGTHLCDIYGPPEAYFRLGTDNQTVIPGHEFVHQTYHDGRDMDVRTSDDRDREPRFITYTTKSDNVHKVTLFFHLPQGLWTNNTGILNGQVYGVRVRAKKNEERNQDEWQDMGLYKTFRRAIQQAFFWKIEVELPLAQRWDIELTVEYQDSYRATTSSMQLFNVKETQYLTTSYPGNALLEIHGIASDQITGFDQMEASALVDGRLVGVFQNGIYVRQFSRNRVWIVRDILLDREVGLGNRLSPSIWDNASGLQAAQYYEENVLNFDSVNEQRDYCDVIISEQKAGWDHIKTLLYEGRAILIPSSGRFKYVLDKDREPNLLHSFPGNIIENSLQMERGNAEPEINTIRAEFPSVDHNYKVVPAKLVATDIGNDPERPEQISFTSLVRKSQVSREMNFRLKKLRNVKRRYTWRSPKHAVVSEPFDIDKLAYKTSKALRGYTGFINGNDSTTTSIVTGKEIFLSSGATYSVHVRHNNTVEERDLTNTIGQTHSILTFSSPLSFSPAVGDVWVAAKTSNQVEKVQIDDVEFDGESFIIRAHHHDPNTYTDTLTDITVLENVDESEPVPPPLLDAQALNFTDGTGTTKGYFFNVVPAFSYLAGTYSFLGTNSVILEDKEPDWDDYFIDSYIQADLDTPRKIIAYDGDTRTAIVDTAFVTAASTGGPYYINWPDFSSFYGFSVEGFNGAWNDLGTATGTSLTLITGSTYSLFRFFPYNINEVENTNAPVTVSEGVFDGVAPQLPLVVSLESDSEKHAFGTIHLTAPLERDIQYLEAVWQSNLSTGDTTFTDKFDVSKYRNEKDQFSPIEITVDRELLGWAYGTTVSLLVASLDFFSNKSPYARSLNSIVLSANPQDPPQENPIDIDDDSLPDGVITGSTRGILFSGIIDGGTLGTKNSIQLDLTVLVTPGSTLSTTLDFHYTFGGMSASVLTAQISDNSQKIADDSYYQLTFKIDALGETDFQGTTAKKVGDEIPTNDIRLETSTLTVDSTVDQTLQILVDINGDTTTTLEVIGALLKQILNSEVIAPDDPTILAEPYIIAGTIPGIARSITATVHPFSIPVTLETNLVTSQGYCLDTATGQAVFSLRKNNTEFGTMTFAAGATIATFIATQTIFNIGDVFTIETPDPADQTLGNIGWSIFGTRS